jgi:hypothetical protein
MVDTEKKLPHLSHLEKAKRGQDPTYKNKHTPFAPLAPHRFS